MGTLRTADSNQPLSARAYAVIALAGLVLAVLFTLFYVYQVPRIVGSGAQNQIFYLLLLPWALSCSAFLFGAMRSYARFTYKHVGNLLELGGPVVLFCIVLVGGFKLVPPGVETFDVTVRAHSADDDDPIITSGKITIDFGADRRPVSIGSNGEADFKGIPAQFKGATVKILAEVDGYEKHWQPSQLTANVVDLALVRSRPLTVLTGSILPPPGKKKGIRIIVDGANGETSPDEFGRFTLAVNGRAGDRVRVKVYADGRRVYDDFQVLPGPIELKLREPR